MVWLKVEANSRTLNFLLDSGAGASVLDSATARRLGVKLGARETVQGTDGYCNAFRVNDFTASVGGIPAPRSVLALDLSPVSQACGTRIDGLLGLDFFRGRVIQLDYGAQKIRVFERKEALSPGGQVLPLARRNGALCVRMAINGNSAEWMRLDTGCSSSLEWVASERKLCRTGYTSIAASTGSPRCIQTHVKLGNEQFTGVRTGLHSRSLFSGEAGLLGNGLLSKFCITIDADRSKLILASR